MVYFDSDDVAIIDEIQMIADLERGGAWTRALLGTRCHVLLGVNYVIFE